MTHTEYTVVPVVSHPEGSRLWWKRCTEAAAERWLVVNVNVYKTRRYEFFPNERTDYATREEAYVALVAHRIGVLPPLEDE